MGIENPFKRPTEGIMSRIAESAERLEAVSRRISNAEKKYDEALVLLQKKNKDLGLQVEDLKAQVEYWKSKAR